MTKSPVKLSGKDTALVQSAGPLAFMRQQAAKSVQASNMYKGTPCYDGKVGDRVRVIKEKNDHYGDVGVVTEVLTDATVKRFHVDFNGRTGDIYYGYEITKEATRVDGSKGFYGTKRNNQGFRPFYCDSEYCDTRKSDYPVADKEPVTKRSQAHTKEYTFCDDDCQRYAMCEVCDDALASEYGRGAYDGETAACDTCGGNKTYEDDRRNEIKMNKIRKLVNEARENGDEDARSEDYSFSDVSSDEDDDDDEDNATALPEDVVQQAFGPATAKAFDVSVVKVQASKADTKDACKTTAAVQSSKADTTSGDCDGCVVCKAESQPQPQPAAVLPSRRAPPQPTATATEFDPLYTATPLYGKPKLSKPPKPRAAPPDLAADIEFDPLYTATPLYSKPKLSKPSKPRAPPDLAADIDAWKASVARVFRDLSPAQQAALGEVDYMERLLNPAVFDPQEQAKWLAGLDAASRAVLPRPERRLKAPLRGNRALSASALQAKLESVNQGLTALLQTWEARAVARAGRGQGTDAMMQDPETQAELKQVMDLMMARPASFLPPATRFQVGDRVTFRTQDGVDKGTVCACSEYEANANGEVCYKIRRRGDGRMFYAEDDGTDLVWKPGAEAAVQPSNFSFGEAWRSLTGGKEEKAVDEDVDALPRSQGSRTSANAKKRDTVPYEDSTSSSEESDSEESDSDDDDDLPSMNTLFRVAPSAANTITPLFPGEDKRAPPAMYAPGHAGYVPAGAGGPMYLAVMPAPGAARAMPAFAPPGATGAMPAYAPPGAAMGAMPPPAPPGAMGAMPAYAPPGAAMGAMPPPAPPGAVGAMPPPAPPGAVAAMPAYAHPGVVSGYALAPTLPADGHRPAYAPTMPPAQPQGPMYVMAGPPPTQGHPPVFMPVPQQTHSSQPM